MKLADALLFALIALGWSMTNPDNRLTAKVEQELRATMKMQRRAA